uniref:Octanoyl-[acyl-carrier-protein]:protein N-octanoyltransferase LIPT2, mitochondrial n=1 Tax=Bursaphelenchus xylophilus TaxID=6326 RepID=A0A1I7S2W0_BURXY
MILKALWFGRRSFEDGLKIQEHLFQSIRQIPGKKNYICLVEHDPVYTVGLRDTSYGKTEELGLRATGADFQRIKRGGLITFHGPGQLVIYPIIDLRSIKVNGKSLGVRTFVDCLEETVIRLCSRVYNIKDVGRTQDPGVWVGNDKKIAAIGVQVRHGITSHGMALNCNVDLKWFDHIVPCGIAGKTATSLSMELGTEINIGDVLRPLTVTLEDVFQSKIDFETVEGGNYGKK